MPPPINLPNQVQAQLQMEAQIQGLSNQLAATLYVGLVQNMAGAMTDDNVCARAQAITETAMRRLNFPPPTIFQRQTTSEEPKQS